MTEENGEKSAPFDAEWEVAKLKNRFIDVLNMIEELKAKDKSLSARISRLRLSQIEEEGEEEPEEREEEGLLSRFESMPIEERAIRIAELIDRFTPP